MDCGQIRSLIHEFYNRLKQEIPKQSQYQEDLKSNSETIKELVSQEFKGLTKSNDEIRKEEIVIFHFHKSFKSYFKLFRNGAKVYHKS